MAWALKVLTDEGARHIAEHKYRPGTYTPLDNFMNPRWTKIAEAMPMWLAPNAITFIGFVPLLALFVVSWYADPLYGKAPSRLLSCGYFFALLFYQTMDAVDGKQARRTGSSSPLGQLLDHGLDCFTGVIQHAALAMVLCSNDIPLLLFVLECIQTGLLLAAWQDYHIGVFPTAAGPVGVTELQFGLMMPMLLPAVVGPEVWQGLATETFSKLGMKAVVLLICGMWTAPLVTTVRTACAERGLAGLSVLQELVPVAILFVLCSAWEPSLLATSPRVVALLTGLSFFWMNAQLIVFTMARMTYPAAQWFVLPYAMAVAASWALPVPLASSLVIVLTMALGGWLLWWLVSVVHQLKGTLGIYVFSITKPYEAPAKKGQ